MCRCWPTASSAVWRRSALSASARQRPRLCSTEPAAKLVLDALNKKALITAGLHLGEGTGAVAAIPLWDMALAVYDGCYSFEEGGIEAYTPQGGEGC